MDKIELLAIFRDKAADFYEEIEAVSSNFKDQATLLNK